MDISNNDDGSSPMDQSQSSQHHHTLMYVVQKCWHSGPKQHVPVDMLRLFPSQREAEEAAYHSAETFHEHPGSTTSSGLKTLLLPSYPAHNPKGSSYGFLARGALFWVRALRATVVTASSNATNGTTCQSQAYAILTEGVIGGTGNRNSRRGTEVCDGRVFGGDAAARAIAEEAVARVRAYMTNPSLSIEAKTVPVGKPVEWLSSGAFVDDWPVCAEIGFGATTTNLPFGTTPKRSHEESPGDWGIPVSFDGDDDDACVTDNTNGNTIEPFMVVDCPFQEPIAKRRRVVSVTDDCVSTDDDAMMQ